MATPVAPTGVHNQILKQGGGRFEATSSGPQQEIRTNGQWNISRLAWGLVGFLSSTVGPISLPLLQTLQLLHAEPQHARASTLISRAPSPAYPFISQSHTSFSLLLNYALAISLQERLPFRERSLYGVNLRAIYFRRLNAGTSSYVRAPIVCGHPLLTRVEPFS